MAEVKTHLTGFDEVLKAIRRTGYNVTQKHMDQATRRGLTVIARTMRRMAPVLGRGNRGLRRAIGSRVAPNKISKIKEAKVGIAVGKKLSKIRPQNRSGRAGVGISARNAHWFILGAGMGIGGKQSPRRKKKVGDKRGKNTGPSTGIMRPIPGADFVMRAFEVSKEEASRTIIDSLWQKAREEFLKK